MNYRFFIESANAGKVFEKWLDRDTQAAQLSNAFQMYYRLRPLIPIVLRQLLQRRRRVDVPKDWFLPLRFLEDLVAHLKNSDGQLSILHPWPNAAQFALVLTHDVETTVGVQNIERIAALEEELGFRSSWNIVPNKYPIDKGLIRDLVSRSFEIGIHGYNHDGQLFRSAQIFERRARAINDAMREYNAVGFRSPMVHRNLKWLQMLDVQYDASCFDVDPYQAMPGGVGSIWPFIAGRFVELPYTMPQDHTLFVVRGEKDCRIWKEKLDFIARHSGMAMMLTHPDYLILKDNLTLYREFLVKLREDNGYWHGLPAEVATWWNERDNYARQRQKNGDDQSLPSHIVPARIELDDQRFSILTTKEPDAEKNANTKSLV